MFVKLSKNHCRCDTRLYILLFPAASHQ